MYPEIQSKVANELVNVFGPTPRYVEKEDLAKLTYLDMCIKDIMRLFPIAPFLMRKTIEDCEVGRYNLYSFISNLIVQSVFVLCFADGYQIPKDCSVIICIFGIHRSAKHWERPNEFYPEHFLPEAVAKRHPFCYIPFSAGPRMCIGKTTFIFENKYVYKTV